MVASTTEPTYYSDFDFFACDRRKELRDMCDRTRPPRRRRRRRRAPRVGALEGFVGQFHAAGFPPRG